MNINHLRYFQEVCKHNNITKASEVVHVSQPSITTAIKELEKELGYQLFNRINNRITLTPNGTQFLSKAKNFIEIYDNFHKESIDIGNKKETSLKIGISFVLSSSILDKLYSLSSNLDSNIKLKIYELETIQGIKKLETGELDFLIGSTMANIANASYTSFDSKKLFTSKLSLITNSQNKLSQEKIISKNFLSGESFVTFPKGSYHQSIITNYFEGYNLNIAMEVNQISTLKSIIEKNLAVTITYKELFKNIKNIKSIPLEEDLIADISLLWKKTVYLSKGMKDFISLSSSIKSF